VKSVTLYERKHGVNMLLFNDAGTASQYRCTALRQYHKKLLTVTVRMSIVSYLHGKSGIW